MSISTYFGIFVALLVAIAAVITPLGLYDDIVPGGKVLRPFNYAPDPSPFGYGTPPRSNLSFSRVCGAQFLELCPGTNFTLIPGRSPYTDLYVPGGYNTSIPSDYLQIWGSGLRHMASTVSSIFDIQWRSPTTLQQDESGKIIFRSGVEINSESCPIILVRHS